ncbi:Aste57867_16203 [Aphanomyces stellatus]|uniref:Aste57867_16203 protein n=1 Tax=Aphanomyces stellatus TaxID=120398 RepID=A0A485L4X2_9STRA|nr:hypothetical protein As57867_016147 [Aphanomyces stellatus]VFT92981.1 Aste57867_16203 [Aphanomyces stellatus]
MAMQKSTTDAAILYERVIDAFAAHEHEEQEKDDPLRGKPPEFFKDIATKWRARLAAYAGQQRYAQTARAYEESNAEVSAQDPTDETATPSGALAAPEPPTHPMFSQFPLGFDINSIGRPAPFMDDPHKARPFPSSKRGDDPPPTKRRARQDVVTAPAVVTTTLPATLSFPGAMQAVFSTTRLASRGTKRHFNLLGLVVRMFEPIGDAVVAAGDVVYVEQDGAWTPAKAISADDARATLVIAIVVPADDSGGPATSAPPIHMPRDRIFVALDHCLTDGMAAIAMQELNADDTLGGA